MTHYACHDHAPYLTRIPMQDGYFLDGVTRTARMVSVPQVMARDCQFTHTELGKADSRCDGCRWRAHG